MAQRVRRFRVSAIHFAGSAYRPYILNTSPHAAWLSLVLRDLERHVCTFFPRGPATCWWLGRMGLTMSW